MLLDFSEKQLKELGGEFKKVREGLKISRIHFSRLIWEMGAALRIENAGKIAVEHVCKTFTIFSYILANKEKYNLSATDESLIKSFLDNVSKIMDNFYDENVSQYFVRSDSF